MDVMSKTKIKRRTTKKTNPSLKETISLALKNPNWVPVAKMLSSSTRKQDSVNLRDIEKETKAGDRVLVLGKVLSLGELSKKVRIAALGFSSDAIIKSKSSKSEMVSIAEEIKDNPKMEGLKILK